MLFKIIRADLGSYIKYAPASEHDRRACLLGQVLRQRDPEAYATAPVMVGVDDAAEYGLISDQDRIRYAGDAYNLSSYIQDGDQAHTWAARFSELFPGDTLEVI